MKKLFHVFICVRLLCTLLTVSANAQEVAKPSPKTTVEVFENGDYFVTVVTQEMSSSRNINSTTSGSKTGTYYNASGTPIWDVTVHGTFSYTYGASATATSATADVYIASNSASFVSKNAYTSGASAYATATVKYISNTVSKTVKLTCDKYGNLS